jgi:two-component system, LuxR family, sensor kinase FixL
MEKPSHAQKAPASSVRSSIGGSCWGGRKGSKVADGNNGPLNFEPATQKSEQRLRQVFESAPNAIVMVAATGVIEMVNVQTEKLFGYSRNELLGRPVELLLPMRYHDSHPRLRDLFLEGPVSRPMGAGRDLFALRKDGSEFPVEIGINPIETDEGIMVLAAVVDISERKRKEEQLRAAMSELAYMDRVASASELSASIAHEVNQPLAAITSSADAAIRWLKKTPPDLDEALKCLNLIANDSLRASEVIRSVRAMFKRDSVELAPIDLNKVIEHALRILREELDTQKIVVQSELTTPPPMVLGHHGQLQQVMLNLIKNAADAMKSSSGRQRALWVNSAVRDHANLIHVSVKDTGEGFNSKNIDRVFDPFFTTKSQGLGIGLTICKSIIEDHHGRIWASSNVDYGSTFHVQLPVFPGRIE